MALSRSFRDRYRPPLSLVVAVVLCIMLLVPLAGVAFFRIYENQLIQTTEAELIAQSAAIAAVAAQRLSDIGGPDLPVGSRTADLTQGLYDLSEGVVIGYLGGWTPLQPRLDLNKTRVLPARPDPTRSRATPNAAYVRAGKDLDPILKDTQKLTLAGFRILDFNGVVIAGSGDIGLSFAHVKEVQKALNGRYASVLRERIVANPRPIYSISRGTSVRVFTALPIVIGNKVAGVVYASRTPSNILKELYLKRDSLLWMVLFVLGATFVVGFIFARAISGPIKALTARSLKIGAGDRSALKPLAIHGNREIHALSTSMLDMSRKLFERNDYINTFANHVTHELKSPLTAIQGAAELLLDGGNALSEQERARFLDNILKDTGRASALLNRLRDLARADSAATGGACRLSDILKDIQCRFDGISLRAPEDCLLPLSAENARIVFGNLIDNSAQHGATNVLIACEETDGSLRVLVSDDGQGISTGNADQVFDLFFTTRRETGGTGMGLGITRALLNAHNATIRHVPGGDGACFEILFENKDWGTTAG
ncbi:sensor histidine kinase [Roseibium aggregatum]|uniref:Signal transduction histidine-protein kinase/phosphatase MprB n=1 Tax=Roseibium aggregatum TaxID=187304 RepID=A0A939E8R7_9HYPH|nr:ATP-binding protein [Roseibium aggregatum]MBN9668956.1 ATP-binding protein [Roseibium aggregatum]